MADHRPAQVADLAWRMFLVATDHQPEPYRESLRKLTRKIMEAQFEAGREKESEISAQRAEEIVLANQQAELQRRLREREMSI